LASRNIVSGHEGQFSPDANITRGQFTKILAGIAGADVSGYTTSAYSDVANDSVYAKYIAWASEKGIIQGVGDGKFAPDAKITREQIVLMLERYAGAEKVKDAAIFDSVNGSITNPKGYATRGEVAKMLTKLMVYLLK
jgi:hypothetical protein